MATFVIAVNKERMHMITIRIKNPVGKSWTQQLCGTS